MTWLIITFIFGFAVGMMAGSITIAQRINSDIRLKAAWRDYIERTNKK